MALVCIIFSWTRCSSGICALGAGRFALKESTEGWSAANRSTIMAPRIRRGEEMEQAWLRSMFFFPEFHFIHVLILAFWTWRSRAASTHSKNGLGVGHTWRLSKEPRTKAVKRIGI
jgi:hypothetical protein